MILITGATGQLARLTIEKLLEQIPAGQIVAAVRNLEKAADLKERGIVVRQGDYDQPHHWPSAMEGVEKVFLIMPPDIASSVRQLATVIEAAKNAGSVRLIAYSSLLGADTSSLPLAEEYCIVTEGMIRRTGLPFTFLRNGWYTENYTMAIESAVQYGAIYGCAKDGRLSGAARKDYADAAAAALTLESGIKDIYELAGDTAFSLDEVASEISRQSGKEVRYVDLTEDEYRKLLVEYGFPEDIANTLAIADTGIANGQLYSESQDLRNLIGRATTPLSTVVAESLKQLHES